MNNIGQIFTIDLVGLTNGLKWVLGITLSVEADGLVIRMAKRDSSSTVYWTQEYKLISQEENAATSKVTSPNVLVYEKLTVKEITAIIKDLATNAGVTLVRSKDLNGLADSLLDYAVNKVSDFLYTPGRSLGAVEDKKPQTVGEVMKTVSSLSQASLEQLVVELMSTLSSGGRSVSLTTIAGYLAEKDVVSLASFFEDETFDIELATYRVEPDGGKRLKLEVFYKENCVYDSTVRIPWNFAVRDSHITIQNSVSE